MVSEVMPELPGMRGRECVAQCRARTPSVRMRSPPGRIAGHADRLHGNAGFRRADARRAGRARGTRLSPSTTQPPRPAGRGKAPSPVACPTALPRRSVSRCAPRSPLRDPDAQQAFAALGLDAAVVAAYGLILPRADPERAALRLPQRPRFAAAALARRRAGAAGDPGRRRRRLGSPSCRWSAASTPARCWRCGRPRSTARRPAS